MNNPFRKILFEVAAIGTLSVALAIFLAIASCHLYGDWKIQAAQKEISAEMYFNVNSQVGTICKIILPGFALLHFSLGVMAFRWFRALKKANLDSIVSVTPGTTVR